MILLAVVIGYVLGVMPFAIPKAIETKQNKVKEESKIKEDRTQAEIIDEWLNGVVNKSKEELEEIDDNTVNQQDIYNEYITGKITPKGD